MGIGNGGTAGMVTSYLGSCKEVGKGKGEAGIEKTEIQGLGSRVMQGGKKGYG